MRWTLPNILTIFRLVAAPGLALSFLFLPRPWADWLALFLFVGASATDWLDGHLARRWRQVSKFGAMLDPIADKAMVVIALATLMALMGMQFFLVLPVAAILFREVFVSGLREYLGDTAGLLKVTKLAKWKTTVQMVAISILIAAGLFEHYFGMSVVGLDRQTVGGILSGEIEDELGIGWKYASMVWAYNSGLILLWVAAILTVITGADYFFKATPYIREHDDG